MIPSRTVSEPGIPDYGAWSYARTPLNSVATRQYFREFLLLEFGRCTGTATTLQQAGPYRSQCKHGGISGLVGLDPMCDGCGVGPTDYCNALPP